MEKKSFVSNTVYNIIYKVCGLLFPFIISVYSSRVLLADGIGKVAYANNIVSYFALIAALGIPNYGIREIAKNKKNCDDLSKVFSELFLINFLSTTVCLISYYFLILSTHSFDDEIILYSVMGVLIFLNYFNVDWFYYGIEEFKFIAVRSIVIKIVMLLAVVTLVRNKDDYVIYALITCLATAGNYIWNMILLKHKGVNLVFNKLNLSHHLRPIFILLCTTVSIELYTMLDTTMLGIWGTDEIVGLYSNSSRLVKVFITLIVSISGALLPRLTVYYNEGKIGSCNLLINKVFSILFILSVPFGIAVFIFSPELINILYGESFSGAVTTTRIFSFLLYFLTFSNLFGTQILLTVKCEKKLLFSTVIGAIVNILFNAILIPQYYQNGAAFASVLSESIVTCLTLIFAKHFFEIKLTFKTIISVLLSTFLMIIPCILILLTGWNDYLKLISAFATGGVFYLVGLKLLNNNELKELESYVKTKTKR